MTGRLRLKPSPRNSRRRRKRGLRRRRIWNALDQNPCFRHILAGEALDCHSIPSTMSSLWRGAFALGLVAEELFITGGGMGSAILDRAVEKATGDSVEVLR